MSLTAQSPIESVGGARDTSASERVASVHNSEPHAPHLWAKDMTALYAPWR